MNHKEMMLALLYGQIIRRPGTNRTTELQLVAGQIRDIFNNCIDGLPADPAPWIIKTNTININGIEVPEPERVAPAPDTTFYMPNICMDGYIEIVWGNTPEDREWLCKGLIHLTKEDAELHTTALLSFTKL